MTQPNTLWTPERTEQLIQLHGDGNSYSEMATVLGTSRNAIAGKCGRLGLISPPMDKAVQAARCAAAAAAREPKPVPVAIVPLNVPLLDRGRFQCSAPYDDLSCCCHPIERGSFCASHARVFYRRAA